MAVRLAIRDELFPLRRGGEGCSSFQTYPEHAQRQFEDELKQAKMERRVFNVPLRTNDSSYDGSDSTV